MKRKMGLSSMVYVVFCDKLHRIQFMAKKIIENFDKFRVLLG